MEPINTRSLLGRFECAEIGIWRGTRSSVIGSSGGGSITAVAAGDKAEVDHRAEFAIPARVSAAAIFCCWLISVLFMGPRSVERWMTSRGAQDSAAGDS